MDADLDSVRWYLGRRSREEVEVQLKPPDVPPLTHIVRKSENVPQFILSYKKSEDGDIGHKIINFQNGKYWARTGFQFTSVVELVECHQRREGWVLFDKFYESHLRRRDPSSSEAQFAAGGIAYDSCDSGSHNVAIVDSGFTDQSSDCGSGGPFPEDSMAFKLGALLKNMNIARGAASTSSNIFPGGWSANGGSTVVRNYLNFPTDPAVTGTKDLVFGTTAKNNLAPEMNTSEVPSHTGITYWNSVRTDANTGTGTSSTEPQAVFMETVLTEKPLDSRRAGVMTATGNFPVKGTVTFSTIPPLPSRIRPPEFKPECHKYGPSNSGSASADVIAGNTTNLEMLPEYIEQLAYEEQKIAAQNIGDKMEARPSLTRVSGAQNGPQAGLAGVTSSLLNREHEDTSDWDIHPRDLIKEELLGAGHFGEVWKVVLRKSAKIFAMKTMKAKTMKTADFEREVQTMMTFRHPNLVKTYAICSGPEMFIVIDFLANGSVTDYMNDVRQNKKSPLTSVQKYKIAFDVLKGMRYLSEENCIHRDLAARNVLLANDLTAKVADFGLALLASGDGTSHGYRDSMGTPWLSTAPEALAGRSQWSTKCDVWSYGVFCWELYTDCRKHPYQLEYRNSQELSKFLKNGGRLNLPECCHIAHLVTKCWSYSPEDRISFQELHKGFRSLGQPTDD